jgi:hypothetical protein
MPGHVHSHRTGRRDFLFLRAAALLCLALSIAACSHDTVTREQARSQLVLAVSLASETELFVDYLRHGRATTNYAREHATDLALQAADSLKDLAGRAEPDLQNQIQQCRANLSLLRREILQLPEMLGNDIQLAAAKNRILRIRDSLSPTQSTL